MLTSRTQTKVDRDRNTTILQNPINPGSQPSVISRPKFRRIVLIDRGQPSHGFFFVPTNKPLNHRSEGVVSLASATKCTVCIQFGHMAQKCPRPYIAQHPTQVS